MVYRYRCCGLPVPNPPTPNHDEAYGDGQDIRHLYGPHQCTGTTDNLEKDYMWDYDTMAFVRYFPLFCTMPGLHKRIEY